MGHALGLRGPKDLLDEIKANRHSPGAPELGVKTVAKSGFSMFCKVAAIKPEIGVVFGWGAVCRDQSGQPYCDTQGHIIDENALVKAAATFMEGARPLGEEHARTDAGQVLFAFPLVSDVAKALGIDTAKTGLIIGVKPDPATLARFQSGELRAFSIAGRHETLDGVPVE